MSMPYLIKAHQHQHWLMHLGYFQAHRNTEDSERLFIRSEEYIDMTSLEANSKTQETTQCIITIGSNLHKHYHYNQRPPTSPSSKTSPTSFGKYTLIATTGSMHCGHPTPDSPPSTFRQPTSNVQYSTSSPQRLVALAGSSIVAGCQRALNTS